MPRRPSASPSIPPSLTPHHAIELLQRRIADLDRLSALRSDDPEVSKWIDTTLAILDQALGKPNAESHEMTVKFKYPSSFAYDHDDMLYRNIRKGVLESCIEQLELLAPPAAQVGDSQYRFHVEIERVSGDLFRNGHYKQAALEAYIRVIDEVKRRSGLNLDGDNLMNQALGRDNNRTPALKFNSLSTESERDEQKAFCCP